MITRITTFIKSYADIIILAAIGFVVRMRIVTLDDLWYDEAFTGNLMRLGKQQFWQVAAIDPHPPLYYVILKLWTTVFGVNDLALRSMSVLFGVLTIVMIYLVVKELFNKETGAVASLLAAVSPFLTSYSAEARSYSMYGFFIILAVYAIIKRSSFGFLGATLLVIGTHYMAAVYLPILAAWYIWIVWKDARENKADVKNKKLKVALKFVPILILLIVSSYLYYPVITSENNNNLNIDWVQKASLGSIVKSVTAYSYGVKSRLAGSDELNNVDFIVDEFILGGGIFVLYLIGIIAVVVRYRKHKDVLINFGWVTSGVFLPMLILIAYTLLQGNNIYVERYLFPSSIFFVISLAYVLTSLLHFEVMGMIVFFYIFTLTKVIPPNYYKGMKGIAQEFRETQSEIIFTSPIDYVIGKYYLNNPNVKLYVPKEPESKFEDWPFIENATPQKLDRALFMTPEESRMTPEYRRVLENLQYGNYQVWIKVDAN